MSKWLAVVLCLTCISACSSSGGGSGGGGGSSGGGAAAAKCNALFDKMCTKLGPCENLSQSQCVSAMNQAMIQQFGSDCSGADQVSSTYDQCMIDLDSYTCGSDIPANCKNVILFQV